MIAIRPLTAVAIASLCLAGCSGLSKERRIAERLERAGLAPRLAACMGEKLARDLDDRELRALAEAAKAPEPDGSRPGRKAILRRIDAIGDPHLSMIVAQSALGCAILG